MPSKQRLVTTVNETKQEAWPKNVRVHFKFVT